MTHQTTIDFNAGLTPDEIKVRDAVMGFSRKNPIAVSSIMARTGISETSVRKIIGKLGCKGLPIGAIRKRGESGVYWASTPEDLEAAAQPIYRQGIKMLIRAGRLTGGRRMSEWMGQIAMELEGKN